MSKTILIWGAPPKVDVSQPIDTSFAQSGNNYGNLLIGNAIHTYLSGNEIVLRTDLHSPQEADERCDHVVIPAANFLWKDFDFGYMADFLEKTSLPITIVGVGAQTNDRTTTSPIHPNTLRLMRLISERSKLIGVRGYYTAEVLAANGIHNISVIGCPSFYTKRKATIKIDISRLNPLKALSVNFSRRVNRHAFNPAKMQEIENALLKFAISHESEFVAQDELEELYLSAGDSINPAAIAKYFHQLNDDVVVEFFKKNTKYFGDEPSWSTYIRTKSASIGTRFHGNLIALINEVPSLTIVHDSRTVEMAALLGMPSIHINSLEKTPSLNFEELLKSANYNRFESNYEMMYKRFVMFMSENDLPHNLVI